MSSRGSIADRWSWSQISASAKPEDVIRHMNDKMAALDRTLARIQERLEYGPVPGAYVPVFMTFPGAVTAVTGACVVSLKSTYPLSLRPLWVTAAIAGGTSVNVTINYTLLNIYTSLQNVALTAVPAGVHMDDRGSFATDMLACNAGNDLRLRLDTAGPVGSPRDLTVMVMFKDVSKVEPA
jgi:hypothetical protein